MTGLRRVYHHAEPMADRPTVDQLKALGAALPPSERLQASETADVLSALVAVVAQGRGILDAAAEGGDAVYAFYHDNRVAAAREAGADEPQRGYVHAPPAPVAPAVATGSQQIDYDALAAAIVRAQQKHEGAPASSDVTPVQEASSGPATAPAQAAADVQSPPARPDSAPPADTTPTQETPPDEGIL